MSDIAQVTVDVTSVLEPAPVPVVVKPVEAVVVLPVAPEAPAVDIEKIVKDVLKVAIKELLEELKKTPLSKLDKDGDGVISASEVKEVVKEQAQKLGCGPSCTIS